MKVFLWVERSRFFAESGVDGQFALLESGGETGVGDPQTAPRSERGPRQSQHPLGPALHQRTNLSLIHS